MSDTILAGNLTVYYLDENRQKRIAWTGTTAKTDVEKQLDIYDAAEDLMTLAPQQNKGLIFSAETPGQFTIGTIDAGDLEPWFIDLKTVEHIIGDFANFTGCAIKSAGWKRVLPGDGTENIGIVVVPVDSGGTIVVGDIGEDITHADGDAGTLLDVIITGGATDYLWIRPDTNLLVDDFNSTSLDLTEAGTSHTATQNAAAVTGEMVWGNVFSQGALLTDTHIYAFQAGTKVTISDDTDNDWWPDGHIDRAFPITDFTTADFPIIDSGFLTIKANQYGSKYTNAVIRMDSTAGGNVSAGLSSGADITNTTGYSSITVSGGSGNFTVGDEITDDVNDARGIITQIDNPGATATYHYYLVGDPLVDFDSNAINNEDDTGAATGSGAPTAQGPALTTWFDGNAFPTYSFTSTQVDISGDTVTEEYGIDIDVNQATFAQMHEYNKYAQRRGSVLDHDGLDGEEWIGLDLALFYSAFTTTIAEGDVATQQNTLATATVVSFPGGTTDVMLLRNTRGTFNDTDTVDFTSGGNISGAQLTQVDVITPVAESSFGTLAGTSMFFSRGVVPTDYKSAEENLFSVIDATGTGNSRPTTITMLVLNCLQYDYISVWRLAGLNDVIDKTEYSATGGEAIGDATLTLDGAIAVDVPGQSVGGSLMLMDVSDDNKEYLIRHDSFVVATGVVTLSNVVIASATGATPTTINESGAFTNAKVGDLVVNNGNGHDGFSYISVVTDNDNAILDPGITSQTTGDAIELNACPVAVNTADQVYFPIIFEFKESDGSVSASMQYLSDINARVVGRNNTTALIKIKGFTSEVVIGTGGGNASITRIPNTVYAG